MTHNVSVYIETYGCSSNLSHSETMAGILESHGCILVDDPKNSDVIIINTCIVKEPTEKKIINRIKKLKKCLPDKKIIIAGCMTIGEYEIARETDSSASLIGPNDNLKILKCIKETIENNRVEYLSEKRENRLLKNRKSKNPLINIVEISQGCLGDCSYCIVNKARGKLKSYPISDIVRDIEMSLKMGYKEIWLTSQDCGCYGMDIDKNIIDLLRHVTQIRGDFRLRLGMSNPNHIKINIKELIEQMKNEKIYNFIHIPVQSGSNSVLSDMNRHYNRKDFIEIVNLIKKQIPDVTIWTDIITGFPGETENDFRETIDLIEKTKPDFINSSKFGLRPGTAAEKMKQVPKDIIKQRSKKLSDTIEKLTKESNKKWVGRECQVLVTERGRERNQYIGRNMSYKSVLIETKDDIIGKFVTVKIKGFGKRHLKGELN